MKCHSLHRQLENYKKKIKKAEIDGVDKETHENPQRKDNNPVKRTRPMLAMLDKLSPLLVPVVMNHKMS